MSDLEKDEKVLIRKTKINTAILNVVHGVGMLSVAALVPNVAKLIYLSDTGESIGRGRLQAILVSRKKLIKLGLLEYKEGFLSLTKLGERKMIEFEKRNYNFKKPKRWDGKWRVIIFDIKEERKNLRDKVRNTLICIGFVRLQNSVWVFPYDCEDLINLLKADFKIGKDILYMIADQIENDKKIREYFGLK